MNFFDCCKEIVILFCVRFATNEKYIPKNKKNKRVFNRFLKNAQRNQNTFWYKHNAYQLLSAGSIGTEFWK